VCLSPHPETDVNDRAFGKGFAVSPEIDDGISNIAQTEYNSLLMSDLENGASRQTVNFLHTKLRPPRLYPNALQRTGLLELLDHGLV
jgi:hypothetical protein